MAKKRKTSFNYPFTKKRPHWEKRLNRYLEGSFRVGNPIVMVISTQSPKSTTIVRLSDCIPGKDILVGAENWQLTE